MNIKYFTNYKIYKIDRLVFFTSIYLAEKHLNLVGGFSDYYKTHLNWITDVLNRAKIRAVYELTLLLQMIRPVVLIRHDKCINFKIVA